MPDFLNGLRKGREEDLNKSLIAGEADKSLPLARTGGCRRVFAWRGDAVLQEAFSISNDHFRMLCRGIGRYPYITCIVRS